MSTTMRTVITSMDEGVSVTMRSCPSDSRPCAPEGEDRMTEQARRKTREDAARSKSGLWGPTHSEDTDDDPNIKHRHVNKHKEGGSDTTKEETTSEEEAPSPPRRPENRNPLNRLYETALAMTPTSLYFRRATASCIPRHDDEDNQVTNSNTLNRPAEMLAHFDPCSPCSHPDVDSPSRSIPNPAQDPPPLGQEDDKDLKRHESGVTAPPFEIVRDQTSVESATTPASRRRQRHMERLKTQARLEMNVAPVKKIEVQPLERSISELTMRSSYGEATAKLAEHRRMAYYAVGKHHGRAGGNRRCYFTGKLILGGAPFYAGSVQQGLRTLVVFCLPSALGLPHKEGTAAVDLKRQPSVQSIGSKESASVGFTAQPRSLIRRARSMATRSATTSRLSSLDDMSLSYEEEMDINDGLDREYLLTVLPAPSQDLLDAMSDRYPEQFETLPVQVRSPHCWRLFVKFCFFSGLPIAEGEMHYKVLDNVAEVYGEEIILSHEVMEAVNGSSAEILRLPNQKTFRYLQKHYTQQCGKLNKEVFLRQSWELVLPEV